MKKLEYLEYQLIDPARLSSQSDLGDATVLTIGVLIEGTYEKDIHTLPLFEAAKQVDKQAVLLAIDPKKRERLRSRVVNKGCVDFQQCAICGYSLSETGCSNPGHTATFPAQPELKYTNKAVLPYKVARLARRSGHRFAMQPPQL